jgi:hypothetical protein
VLPHRVPRRLHFLRQPISVSTVALSFFLQFSMVFLLRLLLLEQALVLCDFAANLHITPRKM